VAHTRDSIYNILEDNNIDTYTSVKDLWAFVEPHDVTASIDSMRVQLDRLVKEDRMEKLVVDPNMHQKRKVAYYRLAQQAAEEVPAPENEETEIAATSLEQLFADFRERMMEHNLVSCSITEDGSVEYEQRVIETRKLTL
jgi:hypothetical protein